MFLQDEETQIFLNGTMLGADGDAVEAAVVWAALNPRQPRELGSLRAVLGGVVRPDQEISLALLSQLDDQRRARWASGQGGRGPGKLVTKLDGLVRDLARTAGCRIRELLPQSAAQLLPPCTTEQL